MLRVLCAATALLFLLAPAEAERTEAHEYVAAGGDLIVTCEPTLGLNAGGACSKVSPGDATVRVEITDDVSPLVGGYYIFHDESGDSVEEGAFCRATTLDVPAQAATLLVLVSQGFSTFDCDGAVGLGTKGFVTFDYA